MTRRRPQLLRLGATAVAAASLAACASLPHPAALPVSMARRPAPPPAPTAITPQPVPPAPPRVIVKPVRAACVPKTLPPRPRYPDTDAALRAAAGAADRYQLMAAGRLLREKRLEELERVVEGCR